MEKSLRQIRINQSMVGIVGLDRVLEEVAKEFSNAAEEVIGEEMIKRLSVDNYIPSSVRDLYIKALLREFKKYTGQEVEEETVSGLEVVILGPGCAECDYLEKECREAMAEMALPGAIEHVTDIKEIARYGVMGVPALLINGKVLAVGRVPSRSKIKEWLAQAAQK